MKVVLQTVTLKNVVKALAIDELVARYATINEADGKSPSTVTWYTEILTSFSSYVKHRLDNNSLPVFTLEVARQYILYLRQKPRFQGHPYTPEQEKPLSTETLRCQPRRLKPFHHGYIGKVTRLRID
jgi:hypothetical protein